MSAETLQLINRDVTYADMMKEILDVPGAFSDTYNRMWEYSLSNNMLYYMQTGTIEPMAAMKRWNAVNRWVNKGAVAKYILRPITIKREDAEGNETAFTKFKLVKSAFGLSDTHGDPLPEVEPRIWDKARGLGALAIGEVAYRSDQPNAQGYSFERSYAINPIAKHPIKTMFHELGHITLGHTAHTQGVNEAQHRGIQEFQAESVAYLCMNELELPDWDKAESRAYISSWLSGKAPDDRSIKQVFSATTAILKAGRVQLAEVAE